MAERVLPSVRILLPCENANFDLADSTWNLKRPWGTVQLPEGARFPFRMRSMWVYSQLTDGIGTFNLAVELLRIQDNGSLSLIGTSVTTRVEFPSGEQLMTQDSAFPLKNVPFRHSGLYQFRLTVVSESGSEVLPGMVTELRVLDRRMRL